MDLSYVLYGALLTAALFASDVWEGIVQVSAAYNRTALGRGQLALLDWMARRVSSLASWVLRRW